MSQVLTIKRYANRKLYNTNTHKYVTLSDIFDFITSGTQFRVIAVHPGTGVSDVDITNETGFDALGSRLRGTVTIEELQTLIKE